MGNAVATMAISFTQDHCFDRHVLLLVLFGRLPPHHADIHVACCEMCVVRNGTLLSLRFCGFLRPATRRPSLWRSLLDSRLIQNQADAWGPQWRRP